MMHGDVDLARDEAKKQVRAPCVVMLMVVMGRSGLMLPRCGEVTLLKEGRLLH